MASDFIMIARLVVMWYSTPLLYALPPYISRRAAEVYVPLSIAHVSMPLESSVLPRACKAAKEICRVPAWIALEVS